VGFVPKRKVYVLKFEGAEFDGLIIKANSLSTGAFVEISTRAQDDAEEGSPATVRLLTDFVDQIVEWNLEKEEADGTRTPWPIGVEALLAQDVSFSMALHGAWMAAIGGVEAPLVESSTGGEKSLEASIPMDVESSNPAS
jgi:hypothetical protein